MYCKSLFCSRTEKLIIYSDHQTLLDQTKQIRQIPQTNCTQLWWWILLFLYKDAHRQSIINVALLPKTSVPDCNQFASICVAHTHTLTRTHDRRSTSRRSVIKFCLSLLAEEHSVAKIRHNRVSHRVIFKAFFFRLFVRLGLVEFGFCGFVRTIIVVRVDRRRCGGLCSCPLLMMVTEMFSSRALEPAFKSPRAVDSGTIIKSIERTEQS